MFSITTSFKQTQTVPLTSLNFSTTLLVKHLTGTVNGTPFQQGRETLSPHMYSVKFDDGEILDVNVHEMKILPGQRASPRGTFTRGEEGDHIATRRSSAGSHATFGEVQFTEEDGYHRGFMYKQTKSKSWTLRYFILTSSGTLISCKSEKPKHQKGTRKVKLIARNWSCKMIKGHTIKGHKNIITIIHRDSKAKQRGFVLSTLTDKAKNDWVHAMKNYIPVEKKATKMQFKNRN